jgi:hypothetical protein
VAFLTGLLADGFLEEAAAAVAFWTGFFVVLEAEAGGFLLDFLAAAFLLDFLAAGFLVVGEIAWLAWLRVQRFGDFFPKRELLRQFS